MAPPPGSSSPLVPTPGLSSELSAPVPGVAPPGSPAESPAAPPGAGTACETVTVVGHWQTRVYPDGQRMTIWVPTRTTCR